jgi:hypothetical protein
MTVPLRDTTGASDEFEIISVYTRAQAIADGVLVDISTLAKEAGFRVPVAVTTAVWETLNPGEDDLASGQSLEGRLWDMLMMLRTSDGGEILFDVLLARHEKRERVELRAGIGPGDSNNQPVITIMRPGED